MLSAFRYRIYPKPEQEMRLKRNLLSLCNLYNRLRVQKIEEYKQNGISLTRTNLRADALEERRHDSELQSVYSQVVQNVADRVHAAFENFFEGRARFPKSKQPKKYLSMTYPQFGFKINPAKGLYLSDLGYIRIFVHRPLVGKIERLTIKRELGEWYAMFLTEREAPPKEPIHTIPTDRVRGVDLGLEKFAVLDNGDTVDHPNYLRQSEQKAKALHQRLVHKQKGSKRWRQTCFSLARLYLHIKKQREDWQNKRISELFAQNDVLVFEKLNIEGMLKNHRLAKSISDAAWGMFARRAIFRAEMLGKHFVAVDPWGTTQFCYSCLAWVPKDLSVRQHVCPRCGIIIPRDLNSGRLIKRLGIPSSPPSDGGSSLAEPRPLPSLRGMVSRGVEAGSH